MAIMENRDGESPEQAPTSFYPHKMSETGSSLLTISPVYTRSRPCNVILLDYRRANVPGLTVSFYMLPALLEPNEVLSIFAVRRPTDAAPVTPSGFP